MIYHPKDLKRVQEIELDILKEIIRVCEENGLTYFTVGGTTLGAVRHNGFIPWDDDIDIGFLREDYDRFIEIAPQKLKKGYTLQHFTTDKNMPGYFAKVRRDGTLFVEKNSRHLKIHHGVFVDIMPYDHIPEKLKDLNWYKRCIRFWHQLYLCKTLWEPWARVENKLVRVTTTIIRSTIHIMLLCIPKAYLYKKLDNAHRRYNCIGSEMVSSRGLNSFECLKVDLIPPRTHAFESIDVAIPNNTDKVLKIQYGDYMKMPPEEKRFNHAPYILKID